MDELTVSFKIKTPRNVIESNLNTIIMAINEVYYNLINNLDDIDMYNQNLDAIKTMAELLKIQK